MRRSKHLLLSVIIALCVCAPAPALQRPRRHKAGAVHSRRRGAPVFPPGRYYTNVEGVRVHSPVHARSAPAGASARCGDGTYSFSRNHRGTCSHHGGVAQWLD